jgi:ABC-type nitrate/sulfonate/bicarbonate transport system substrate-binding protein
MVINLKRAAGRGRRSTARRVGIVGSAAAALALLASACSSSGGSTTDPSASGGLVNVTIAYAAPVPDHMVAAVTEAAGIFKQYGINAKIEYITQRELLPQLVAGTVQFGSMAAPGYEIPDLNGSTLQAVATYENSFDVVLVSGPKYPTLQSLNGKSVAISGPGSFSDLTVKMVEQEYGITMTEEPLGSTPAVGLAAFKAGEVQALAAVSPNQVSVYEKDVPGMHVLLDYRSIRDVPAISIVGSSTWMSANRSTTIKVLKALIAGDQYFKTHETQAVATIMSLTSESQAEATAGYENTLKAMSTSLVPSVSAEQKVLSLIAPEYAAAKTFDASKLINTSYIESALGNGS